MDRQAEIELIDELLALKSSKSAFLDAEVGSNAVEHYANEAHFALERERIFKRLPATAAHVSEVAKPGDFVRREVHGLPLLITRDKLGEVHAFLNVCRHRGTRLVDEEAGCRHRFSCPYHAWTYASSGELIGAPHFESGFPSVEKAKLSLKRVACRVRFGFVWVMTADEMAESVDTFFEELSDDLDALALENATIVGESRQTRRANWKILVEGGIEAYHFRITHRSTIGPHFEDNLSSYRMFGPHIRSVLPRTSMARLEPETRHTWRLRDHANVLYTMFPTNQLLVQQDHVAWIRQEPLSAGESELRVVLLAPEAEAGSGEHWLRNLEITRATLDEDFHIAESIQAGLAAGANGEMLFGRFEGALSAFNRTVGAFVS